MGLSRDQVYNMAATDIAKIIQKRSHQGELENVKKVNVDGDSVRVVVKERFETKKERNQFEHKLKNLIQEWPFVLGEWEEEPRFMNKNESILRISSLNPAFGGCNQEQRDKHDEFLFHNEDGYQGLP